MVGERTSVERFNLDGGQWKKLLNKIQFDFHLVVSQNTSADTAYGEVKGLAHKAIG